MALYLITGTTRGIGRTLAERLLARGDNVIGIARGADHPPGTHAIALDLADTRAIRPAVQAALREQSAPLQGVLSNAGAPIFGDLEQLSENAIERALQVNLASHIALAKAVLPSLKRDGGDLVFMGSEASLRGGAAGSVYCAAKFALRGFAQALRQECASSGVRVMLINPGMVRGHFHDHEFFEPGPLKEHALTCDDVVDCILQALALPRHAVVDEITLSPLKRVVQFKKKSP